MDYRPVKFIYLRLNLDPCPNQGANTTLRLSVLQICCLPVHDWIILAWSKSRLNPWSVKLQTMGSGKGVKSKRFYQFKPAVDFGRWTSSRECLGGGQLVQRGAKPKNGAWKPSPLYENGSKGGLRARGTEHPHSNLVFTKTAWHRHLLLSCGIKSLPPLPHPLYGDVARKGLGIKAHSIFFVHLLSAIRYQIIC